MVDSLLKIISAALSIAETEISRKYIDQKVSLERSYLEESNKPLDGDNRRSDAVLDSLRSQLCILADAISADIGQSHAANKPNPAGV